MHETVQLFISCRPPKSSLGARKVPDQNQEVCPFYAFPLDYSYTAVEGPAGRGKLMEGREEGSALRDPAGRDKLMEG